MNSIYKLCRVSYTQRVGWTDEGSPTFNVGVKWCWSSQTHSNLRSKIDDLTLIYEAKIK